LDWVSIVAVYRIIEQGMHKSNRSYAWYIRVADTARLIQHIVAPLERRLSQSAMAGYSGELLFDFYRSGLQLTFSERQNQRHHPTRQQWQSQRRCRLPAACVFATIVWLTLHPRAEK
jgi:hypothetical protein